MKKLLIVCVLFIASCGMPPLNPTQPYDCENPDRYRKLLKIDDAIPNRYIVKFRDRLPAKSFFLGTSESRIFERAVSVQMTRSQARKLLRLYRAEIEYIEPERNFIVHNICDYNLDGMNGRDLGALDGDCANGCTGADIPVYIADTGLDPEHEWLKGLIKGWYSVYDGPVEDDNGHGTHVAGIVVQIAPRVNLYSVKIFDSRGSATTSDVLAGIDLVTKEAIRRGVPCVAVGSWGGGDSPSINGAMCRSEATGLVYWAVAAGNSTNTACRYSPARVKQLFTVFAYGPGGRYSDYSNGGVCADIGAPGDNIESARMGGGTVKYSGTSMSAPAAGGVIACLLEQGKDPKKELIDNATIDQIKAIIIPETPNKAVHFNRFNGG